MRKNKKNAFTLIELLAVIVILAIIALIATPIILGIVEDARKDSFMRSVELVVGTTDIDIFSKNFTDSYTYTIIDGVVSNLEVGVKNTDGMNGKIKYDKNGNDTYAIHNGKYCVIKTSGMKKAEITDYVEGECVLGKATDVKYFTYEEETIFDGYEIVDTDVCVEFFTNRGYQENDAITICNNGKFFDEMSLTEALDNDYFPSWELDDFKEAEVIKEKILVSGIEITGYSEEGPKEVIIPEEINGKKVVSIGSYAFSDKALTSVTLPETLVRIRNSAFSTNLFTDITLPSDLEIIEDYAFCYTDLNQTSTDNIEKINEYAYCEDVTAENCFTYEEATITTGYEIVDVDACASWFESSVGYTNEEALSMCNNEPQDSYDGLTLQEALLIGNFEDREIDKLKEAGAIEEVTTSVDGIEITGYQCASTDVVIPSEIDSKKVVSIGIKAFFEYQYSGAVSYLDKGIIRPVNYELASVGPKGTLTSIAIPDSVKYIESSAFKYNYIHSLKLSSNLLKIMNDAFFYGELVSVSIPNSVKYIGNNAFLDNFLSNLIIYDNNQLEIVGNGAFICMRIPEDSKGYQTIYNINLAAIGNRCIG